MASRKDAGVARVAALRYWRVAEAGLVVEAWRRSGETLRRFAERYGIQVRRLSRWASELEREEEAVQFHPVRLVEAAEVGGRGGEPIEIELEGGCTVRVGPGFAAEDLARVLTVLGVEAGC
jgi:hypothetical protein